MAEAEKKQKTLHDILQELSSKNKLQEYIDFYSHHCNKYSFNNSLKIFMQFPDATYVAGKKQWREKGRILKENAEPILLYAPKFEWQEVDGRKVRFLKEWTTVECYDISQTIFGDNCTNSGMKITLDNLFTPDFLFSAYSQKVDNEIITLPDAEMTEKFGENTKGYCDYQTGKIYIRIGESIQMLKSLFHELAHYTIHKDLNFPVPVEEREIEAELCAYVALKYLDIEVDQLSMEYLAAWINSTDDKKLKYNLSRIEMFAKFFCNL